MLKHEAEQSSVEDVYLEEKKAEEALLESEERFRNVFESAYDCIIILDRFGRILDVNAKAVEVFGGSKEEVLGKHFIKLGLFSPKDIPTLMNNFANVLAGKKTTINVRIKNKKGRLILLECLGSFMKIDDKLAGVMVIARDVTERKRMEEALRESEEKYRTQFEEALDAIFVGDAETGRIIDCNRAASELVGREKSELIGKHQRILHPSEEIEGQFSRTYKQHLKEKEGQVLETQVITKSGEIKNVAIKANVFELRGKKLIQGIFRDITEREGAEEALRKSENKSRTLLENLPQKIFFKDKNSVYISCNENYARDLKINSNKIAGRTDYDFYPKELAEKYRADDKRIMEYGKTEDIEEEYIQDGQKVFVHTVKTPVKDENGNVVGILGIFWDITEQKKAKEKIRESEEKYRVLVESAADAIFTLDEAGNFISANREAAKSIGKTPKDMIGKSMYDLFPKHIADLQMRGIKAVFQTGNPIIANEALTETKFGKRWFNTTIMPITDSNGKIICVMGIARDVTERKEMEEKLRHYSEHLEELVQKRTEELLESEKRYSVLVEEASDGVAILQDGKITFTNKKGSEMIGYPKDELIGLPFEKLVDEKYRQLTKKRYEQRLRGEIIPSTYEIELVAKNGTQIPVELSATRIDYQGRPADLIVVRDIRERKRMEEQRSRLEKLATIGELATMVGHDLRNPLQSIENAAYYLNNELTNLSTSVPMSPKTTEMLQVINDSINYADKIVRDLQDFSVTKAPAFKEIDINTLITETLSQVKAPENVQLRTELAQLPQIKVDKDQIKRVFLNLTTNAIQAMENGGILTVSTKKTNGFVEVSFKDTGVGITKENMTKIFTPFFTTRAKGMGMGLSICKKFVDAHGGSIGVKSEAGKGTTLTIKLPITKEIGGEKQ